MYLCIDFTKELSVYIDELMWEVQNGLGCFLVNSVSNKEPKVLGIFQTKQLGKNELNYMWVEAVN